MKQLLTFALSLWMALTVAANPLVLLSGNGPNGGGGEGSTVVATDDFESYTQYTALDLTSNWVDVSASQIFVYPNPNYSAGAGVSQTVIGGIRHTGTVAADHYASGVLGITGSIKNSAIGPAVRMQSGSDSWYALVYFRALTSLYLVKSNAGTVVTVTGPISKTYATGNAIKLAATGAGSATRLTAYEDIGSGFVAIGSLTAIDPGGTYLDGGFAGLAGQAIVGEDPENVLTSWESGNN